MEDRSNEVKVGLSYDADTQKQMEAIRAKYVKSDAAETQESALTQMRRLDARVESKVQIISLAVGIVAALLLGTGMSAMLVWSQPFVGIAVGILGLAGVIAAFPIYQRVLKKEREKIAPEIVRLSEQA